MYQCEIEILRPTTCDVCDRTFGTVRRMKIRSGKVCRKKATTEGRPSGCQTQGFFLSPKYNFFTCISYLSRKSAPHHHTLVMEPALHLFCLRLFCPAPPNTCNGARVSKEVKRYTLQSMMIL